MKRTPNYASPFASYKDGFGDNDQLGIEPAVVGLIRGNNIRQLLVTPMQTLPNGTASLNVSLITQPANTGVAGKIVRFQVNGISTITGSATTSAGGTATWTYTRATVSSPGRDVVTVYVDDLPANASFDPAEDSAVAYVNWGNPIVTVTAIDATASEPGSDTATIRFSRTGSTASSLTVRFLRLGGAQTENPNNSPDYLMSSSVQVKSVPEANQAYVTIPAGQASVDVTITPTDDSNPELTEEAIFLIMDPDSGSSNYSVGLPYKATVSITDNDTTPVVTISSAAPLGDASASEAGLDTGTFKIIRTGSLEQDLIVRFSLPTGSGSAFYGSDYLLQYYETLNGSLQNLYDGNGVFIRAGLDTVLVYVQPLQDSRNEGSETVTMRINPDPAYVVGSPASATVTIADNDTVTLPLSYTITEIGGYPGKPSHAYAVDNSSPPRVVGDWVPNPSSSAARPFRYQNGTITDLGLFGGGWTFEYAFAYAINGPGVVVGYGKYSPIYPYRGPVYWNPTITAIDASTGEQGPQAALGINNAGNIVGYLQWQISPGEKQGHAVYWAGPSSPREDLGVLAGSLSSKASYATAINNNLVVVGTSMTDYTASGFHGFRIDRSAQATLGPLNDVGTLLGVDQTSSECTAINDLNEAVGGSTALGQGQYHAFWKAGNAHKNDGFIDLGTLAGDNYSVALGINGIGHIVGTSKKTTSPTSQRAFVSYNNGQMVNLITKVSNPTGWTLLTAQGINTAGYIVGYGLKNGAERGYLLAPSN